MSLKKMLLIGEPMGLFIAQEEGPLSTVNGYSFAIAGAEYNVAIGMSRLGHGVDYITKLGRDPFGERIVRGMVDNGIDTTGITWSDSNKTGFMLKSKVASGDPQVCYFRKDSAASTIGITEVESLELSQYSHLHMTGILPALSNSCLEASETIMKRARAAGVFVSFDPNLRPVLWESEGQMIAGIHRLAGYANLILPGIAEGELLTGSNEPPNIANFYLDMGIETVVVKLGAKGAYVATRQQQQTIPGFTVPQVVDTVGAGDGFAVGVISALKEGLPLSEAVSRGNAIGAIQVTHMGDNEGLPTREQLAAFMEAG